MNYNKNYLEMGDSNTYKESRSKKQKKHWFFLKPERSPSMGQASEVILGNERNSTVLERGRERFHGLVKVSEVSPLESLEKRSLTLA